MDQRLVEQFIAGDPGATTPLRNQLRTLAARVLGAPQWGLQDSGLRAQMEREAAQATLDSGEKTVQGLTEEAMAQAGASGIRFLRRRDVVVGEHPDPLELARVGLGAASAAQNARVDGHLSDCEACRHHMEALQHALRTAATAQAAPKAPTRPIPQAPAPRPRSARRKDKPLPPKPKRSRTRPKKGEGSGSLPILPLFGLLVVAAGVVWKLQPTEQQRVWARSALLPDELPPTQRAPLYSGTANKAISQLRDGNCKDSARTLHLEAKGQGDPWLYWYEGTAWVCAREGDRALEAFDEVAALSVDGLPWGYDWWRAQALILEGEDEAALALLDGLAQQEHGRSADARALASALRNAEL